jgi:hypothetical protein
MGFLLWLGVLDLRGRAIFEREGRHRRFVGVDGGAG